MRKRLFVGLLGLALVIGSLVPFFKSDAALAPQQDNISKRVQLPSSKFPDYDIRLVGKNEFIDEDVISASAKQVAGRNLAMQERASGVEAFRSRLSAEKARNLRATVNETGAIKNLFIDGDTLSEPRSDTANNIARNFLEQNASVFALSDVATLELSNEDTDRGTVFLEYFQTVGGFKVFEGEVQVAVNKNGEVLSVREGFLVTGQQVKLKPQLSEAQGIARAFKYAGRDVFPSFAETYTRASKSEKSRFSNPISQDLEEVTSELNVMRVGEAARLAWHVYADAGPNAWYEILVDAHNGELLFRRNIYVSEAQGTVYTEDPGKGPRQLVSFVGNTTYNTSFGWMGTATVTTGNNVESYLDTDANNSPDNNNGSGLSVGHASAANQNFTFPFSTTVDPRTQQAAVVTNLFYFNNVMHDFSYGLGFTETARNFQTNNYGRGGVGNDSVRAEAQDGSGTNNANFATPPDGSRPRMQQLSFHLAESGSRQLNGRRHRVS